MSRFTPWLALFALMASSAAAQQPRLVQTFRSLHFEKLVGLYHTPGNDGRMFAIEQMGRIRVFDNRPDVDTAAVFLDLTGSVTAGVEMGLLGLAFDPGFDSTGIFYVHYSRTVNLADTAYKFQTCISRFHVRPDAPNEADPASEEILLAVDQPFDNHKAGQLVFGADGYLYIGMGDGGNAGDPFNLAQDCTQLCGKILRIDVRAAAKGTREYAIPKDNPFVGNMVGWREEIYAYGLRNPWRFSFDPATNRLWCGDVGQNMWEEIDTIRKGGNYGWNILEARSCYSVSGCDSVGKEFPVWAYRHDSAGGMAVTGGFVYHGSLSPSLEGAYVYGDFISGRIWALRLDGAEVVNQLVLESRIGISSFGLDAGNELHVCSYDGRIFMLSEQISGAVVDDGAGAAAAAGALVAIRPSPVTTQTTIDYVLNREAQVRVGLFDLAGRKLMRLANARQRAGTYSVRCDATNLADGVYVCRLVIGNRAISRTFVVAH